MDGCIDHFPARFQSRWSLGHSLASGLGCPWLAASWSVLSHRLEVAVGVSGWLCATSVQTGFEAKLRRPSSFPTDGSVRPDTRAAPSTRSYRGSRPLATELMDGWDERQSRLASWCRLRLADNPTGWDTLAACSPGNEPPSHPEHQLSSTQSG